MPTYQAPRKHFCPRLTIARVIFNGRTVERIARYFNVAESSSSQTSQP
jgi:hypothetical protein